MELSSRGKVILLDVDGYACESRDIPIEVTVPENAKQKVHLVFAGSPGKVGKLRVFGKNHEIPRDRIMPPKTNDKGDAE